MNDETLRRFKAVVEASPDDELARFSLGNAYWGAGRYAEARDELQKATALKPDWMAAAILLGKCHMELGEKEKAKEVLQKALTLATCQKHTAPREEIEGLLRECESHDG